MRSSSVQAEVIAEGRNDRAAELVVGRLSLEPGVSEALWLIGDTDRPSEL